MSLSAFTCLIVVACYRAELLLVHPRNDEPYCEEENQLPYRERETIITEERRVVIEDRIRRISADNFAVAKR